MKKIVVCTDCGGLAVVTGIPDDYRILCNHCDPRGPIVKRVVGKPQDVQEEQDETLE